MNADVKAELAKTEQPATEWITPTSEGMLITATLVERALNWIHLKRAQKNLIYHQNAFYKSFVIYFEKKFKFNFDELSTLKEDEIIDFIKLALVAYSQSSWLIKPFCRFTWLSRTVFHYNEICMKLGLVESWISSEDFNKTIVALKARRNFIGYGYE